MVFSYDKQKGSSEVLINRLRSYTKKEGREAKQVDSSYYFVFYSYMI